MASKYWAWNNGENGRPFIRRGERADGSVHLTQHNAAPASHTRVITDKPKEKVRRGQTEG